MQVMETLKSGGIWKKAFQGLEKFQHFYLVLKGMKKSRSFEKKKKLYIIFFFKKKEKKRGIKIHLELCVKVVFDQKSTFFIRQKKPKSTCWR